MKIILIICLVFFAGCGDLDIYVDEVDAPIGLSQPYCFGSVEEIEDYCGIQNRETNGGGY